jgi:hypothetical protein
MNDYYGPLQALSKHPESGRYIYPVTKYTYKESEDIIRVGVCNDNITEREFNKYLAKTPKRFSVFIYFQYRDSAGHFHKELIGLYCVNIKENTYSRSACKSELIISPGGFERGFIDEFSPEGRNYKIINNYNDAINIPNHYMPTPAIFTNSSQLKDKTWWIFFDPFTCYNIFENRINCNKLLFYYSSDKAVEQFERILSLLSDKNVVHLLLVYLIYTLRVIELRANVVLSELVPGDIKVNADKYLDICDDYIETITNELTQ